MGSFDHDPERSYCGRRRARRATHDDRGAIAPVALHGQPGGPVANPRSGISITALCAWLAFAGGLFVLGRVTASDPAAPKAETAPTEEAAESIWPGPGPLVRIPVEDLVPTISEEEIEAAEPIPLEDVEIPEDPQPGWFDSYRNGTLRTVIGDRTIVNLDDMIVHARLMEDVLDAELSSARTDWTNFLRAFPRGSQGRSDAQTEYNQRRRRAWEHYRECLQSLVDQYAEDSPK
jgi:hypothetical protein